MTFETLNHHELLALLCPIAGKFQTNNAFNKQMINKVYDIYAFLLDRLYEAHEELL